MRPADQLDQPTPRRILGAWRQDQPVRTAPPLLLPPPPGACRRMAGGQSGQWREVHPSRSHRPETGSRPRYEVGGLGENRLVTRAVEELNRRMLRSGDAIDRTYA